jgi:outer membrane protein, heavy metal efflux system
MFWQHAARFLLITPVPGAHPSRAPQHSGAQAMNKILVIFLAAIALLLPGPALQAGSPAAEGQRLAELVAEAMANNPELEADEARWQSYMERARQAGTLEDPMLMLGVQNLLIRDPFAFDRDETSAKVIGISQSVPFFGKRDLQRQAARQDAEAARWTLEERRIELTRMVKESWYQLLFIDAARKIVERNIAVLDDLSRLSETLYGVGRALLQDVLKAQVERSKMEEMRISLIQQRRSLEAALNTLRFQPADLPIVPVSALELTPLTVSSTELAELAAGRPLLLGFDAQEQKASAFRQLAAREFYPDFTFTLEYMQRQSVMDDPGYDMFSAGVTFNLPVRRERRHAMAAEADAEIRMARAEREMARNQIRLGIADGLARLERNRRLAELYQGSIIPQSENALEAATAAYRAGTADFMNVLDSQTVLFGFEREYIEAVAEHQMQLAALEAVIGRELQ